MSVLKHKHILLKKKMKWKLFWFFFSYFPRLESWCSLFGELPPGSSLAALERSIQTLEFPCRSLRPVGEVVHPRPFQEVLPASAWPRQMNSAELTEVLWLETTWQMSHLKWLIDSFFFKIHYLITDECSCGWGAAALRDSPRCRQNTQNVTLVILPTNVILFRYLPR